MDELLLFLAQTHPERGAFVNDGWQLRQTDVHGQVPGLPVRRAQSSRLVSGAGWQAQASEGVGAHGWLCRECPGQKATGARGHQALVVPPGQAVWDLAMDSCPAAQCPLAQGPWGHLCEGGGGVQVQAAAHPRPTARRRVHAPPPGSHLRQPAGSCPQASPLQSDFCSFTNKSYITWGR